MKLKNLFLVVLFALPAVVCTDLLVYAAIGDQFVLTGRGSERNTVKFRIRDDGTLYMTGLLTTAPGNSGSAIALSATTTLTPTELDSTFMLLTSTGGALVMSSEPHISITNAVDGDIYRLFSTVDTISFVDTDNVSANSLFELGASTRALGVGDILDVIFYNGKWYEIGFYNND